MVDHQANANSDDQQTYNRAINKHLAQHKLPRSYLKTVTAWLEPIAANIVEIKNRSNLPINRHDTSEKRTIAVLGVQGTQGSGKSTCSEFLKLILNHRYNLTVAVLSIDDFYLTRNERKKLAQDIHPLLETRGVPGTHDVTLAINTIERLKSLESGDQCTLPRFDKSVDDRSAEESWQTIEGPIDLVILEGWCVGLSAEDETSLANAINELETNEDPSGDWRRFANTQLQTHYQKLFGLIDCQLVLRAPSFTCVYDWRLKQEQKLIEKVEKEREQGIDHSNTRLMSGIEITRFIAHYERLTEHALTSLPKSADWCLWLNKDQSIERMTRSYKIQNLDRHHQTNFLVVTDLDGTLLDHHSYSWNAAVPSLNFLKQQGIPVVINTSKTYEEVVELQKAMDIEDPFVVENGSALYLPLDFFEKHHIALEKVTFLINKEKLNLLKDEQFYCIVFGQHRKDIVKTVYDIRDNFSYKFSGYSDWTINQLIDHTGLSKENAELSMKRLYSEPMIWNDSEKALSTFAKNINDENLSLLKGGRFYHVLGDTNKAKPVVFLKHLLSLSDFGKITGLKNTEATDFDSEKSVKVIALGDSPNDKDMLEIAEYPVWVKSPKTSYPDHKCKVNPYLTRGLGPVGWHEAIETIFSIK